MPTDLINRVQRFLERFETVFDGDWSHTKTSLDAIAEDGTFLDPTPGEFFEGDAIGGYSWSNYGGLLDEYRALKAFMVSEGLYPPE